MEKIDENKILNIAVLFSGGASAARFLMEKDPFYGKNYRFVFALTNRENASGRFFFDEKEIVCPVASVKRFCMRNDYSGKIKDIPENTRRAYFRHVMNLISHSKIKPDIIMLSGFDLRIVEPLLSQYFIINVHPARLDIKNEDGTPKYTGNDAVTLAINSGETSTASTIHVVEEELDKGKIICISKSIKVLLGTSAEEHQEKMKIKCDGPAYQKALYMICNGKFKLKS